MNANPVKTHLVEELDRVDKDLEAKKANLQQCKDTLTSLTHWVEVLEGQRELLMKQIDGFSVGKPHPKPHVAKTP